MPTVSWTFDLTNADDAALYTKVAAVVSETPVITTTRSRAKKDAGAEATAAAQNATAAAPPAAPPSAPPPSAPVHSAPPSAPPPAATAPSLPPAPPPVPAPVAAPPPPPPPPPTSAPPAPPGMPGVSNTIPPVYVMPAPDLPGNFYSLDALKTVIATMPNGAARFYDICRPFQFPTPESVPEENRGWVIQEMFTDPSQRPPG